MHQTLISHGTFIVNSYPTMLALGFIVATILLLREADRRGLELPPQLGLIGFLSALVGAKVLWFVQNGKFSELYKAVYIWEGGLSFFGGLLACLIVVHLYLRWYRVPQFAAADIVAPYVALGQCFMRVGCFLNGCCYGKTCDYPWALQFPSGTHVFNHQLAAGEIDGSALHPLPSHPTQLYSAIGLFLLFLWLRRSLNWKWFDGLVAVHYGLFYGILRFTVDFFRADSTSYHLGLTDGQYFSLTLIVVAIITFFILKKSRMDGVPACDSPSMTDAAEEVDQPPESSA